MEFGALRKLKVRNCRKRRILEEMRSLLFGGRNFSDTVAYSFVKSRKWG